MKNRFASSVDQAKFDVELRPIKASDIPSCVRLRLSYQEGGVTRYAGRTFWTGFLKAVVHDPKMIGIVATNQSGPPEVLGYTVGTLSASNLYPRLIWFGGPTLWIGLLLLLIRSPLRTIEAAFNKRSEVNQPQYLGDARQITWIVDKNQRKRGLGRALYLALLRSYLDRGVNSFIGSVDLNNCASMEAHHKFRAKLIGYEWIEGLKHAVFWHDIPMILNSLQNSVTSNEPSH